MDMRPNLDPNPNLGLDRTPGQDPGPIVEAPDRPADSAPIGVDAELDNPMRDDLAPPPAASPAKAPATIEQQQILAANIDALRPLVQGGQLKGKAMEALVAGTGPASAISEVQATRAISLLEKATSPAPAAPANTPEGFEPPAAPGMPENDASPESSWQHQAAEPWRVQEANRLLNNRLDDAGQPRVDLMRKPNEILGEWVAKGSATVPMDGDGNFDLSALTNGQFGEIKAAAQSASLQTRAARIDFEQMRPGKDGGEPIRVGDAVQTHVDSELARVPKAPDAIREAVKDPELMKMLEAARNTNLGLRASLDQRNLEKGTDFKLSIYDRAPELESAAKFAIAKARIQGVELTPEVAAANMKEAISAGTNGQLYRNADAEGIHDFTRDVKLREPRAASPAGPANKPDNAWTKEKIDAKDIPAVKAALADPTKADRIPEAVMKKIELGVPAEGLTKGDLASLRKAGVVEGAAKAPFNGKDPVSELVTSQIKDLAENRLQAALTAGLGLQLLTKLKDLADGKAVAFNKFDAMELRKTDLIPSGK